MGRGVDGQAVRMSSEEDVLRIKEGEEERIGSFTSLLRASLQLSGRIEAAFFIPVSAYAAGQG